MSTSKTGISWTDRTLNPTRGCSIVSEGCRACYAMKLAYRFSGPGQPYEGLVRMTESGPKWTGKIRLVPEALEEPLRWKKPARIFVDSMSDLWHPDVPLEFIADCYVMMRLAHWHTFQILTKRPERRQYWRKHLEEWVDKKIRDRCGEDYAYEWPLPNVWEGVSIEDQATADERIPLLLQTPAVVRFVSYEPALEGVKFDGRHQWCPTHDFVGGFCIGACADRRYISWLIIGGESGPGARPFHVDWARSAIADCARIGGGTRIFLKQIGALAMYGSVPNEAPEYRWLTKDRKGGDPSEWPEDLQNCREFPE